MYIIELGLPFVQSKFTVVKLTIAPTSAVRSVPTYIFNFTCSNSMSICSTDCELFFKPEINHVNIIRISELSLKSYIESSLLKTQ